MDKSFMLNFERGSQPSVEKWGRHADSKEEYHISLRTVYLKKKMPKVKYEQFLPVKCSGKEEELHAVVYSGF